MPVVVLFREGDGRVPLVAWMRTLPPDAKGKCLDRLERLRLEGHGLRRPLCDYLRDGIYELRVRRPEANYRILYFFHGREAVVVSHGFVKSGAAVPESEIDRAIERRWRFESDPARYRLVEGED